MMAEHYILSEKTYKELVRVIEERGLTGGGSFNNPNRRHVTWVLCESTTPDPYYLSYPATARSWDTDTGTWIDHGSVHMILSDDTEPTVGTTYLGIRAGDLGDGTPLFVCSNAGSGGDTSFLAVLTAKDYDDNNHITYSWRAVEQSGYDGAAIVYTTTNQYGEPGNFPAFSTTNRDMVIWPSTTYGEEVDQLSVVRLRPGEGEYYVFGDEPWTDLFRRTGFSDEYGEIAYHRYYDPLTGWQDGREVRLIFSE